MTVRGIALLLVLELLQLMIENSEILVVFLHACDEISFINIFNYFLDVIFNILPRLVKLIEMDFEILNAHRLSCCIFLALFQHICDVVLPHLLDDRLQRVIEWVEHIYLLLIVFTAFFSLYFFVFILQLEDVVHEFGDLDVFLVFDVLSIVRHSSLLFVDTPDSKSLACCMCCTNLAVKCVDSFDFDSEFCFSWRMVLARAIVVSACINLKFSLWSWHRVPMRVWGTDHGFTRITDSVRRTK